MGSFQATGLWWTPENPAKRVAGSLHFSDEKGLDLALIGTLGEDPKPTQTIRPVILGLVYDFADGKLITLKECQRRRLSTTYPGFSREEYRVTRAFIGGHLEREIDFEFRAAQLDLCGLAEWAEVLTGIDSDAGTLNNNEFCRVAYVRHEPLIAFVPGGKISLSLCPSSTHAARRFVLEENLALFIECEAPLSADNFNAEYVYPLQNFITFALEQPAAVRDFSVWPSRPLDDAANYSSFKVVGPRVFSEERYEAEKGTGFSLFRLVHVKERFAEVVGRWLEISKKLADSCNLFFGIQYVRKPYLDTRFLAVVQALELYHAQRAGSEERQQTDVQRYNRILESVEEQDRAWLRRRLGSQPRIPFHEILAALVGEHQTVIDPLCNGDRDGFVAGAAAAYEYILYRKLVAEGAPHSNKDLYWLMERLRIVMKDCFLSELGFSTAERKQLFESNALYQHLRNLG